MICAWELSGDAVELRKAFLVAQEMSDLTRHEREQAVAFPGGERTVMRDELHLMSDYFSDISCEMGDTIRMKFIVKPNAKRFWKDLMVRVMKRTVDAGNGLTFSRLGRNGESKESQESSGGSDCGGQA